MATDKSSKLVVEQTFGERFEGWYERNGNWLNILLIVIFAGIIGYKAYDWMQQRNIARANAEYNEALTRYDAAAQAQDPAQKKDQLNGAITAAQQVVNEHNDKFVGREAQLLIGNAQFAMAFNEAGQNTKMLETARDSFKKYIDMAQTSTEKAAGHLARGNVLENLSFIQSDPKLLNEAVADYKEALGATEGTYLGGEAKLALARALAGQTAKEANEQAEKIYREVAESRDVQLVSKEAIGETPVKLTNGQTLPPEQLADLMNLSNWSQRKMAEDSLVRLK